MSQKGRAKRIRKVLEFIRDKDKVNISLVLQSFVEMGITQRTLKDYLKTLNQAGFIKTDSKGFWDITEAGWKFWRKEKMVEKECVPYMMMDADDPDLVPCHCPKCGGFLITEFSAGDVITCKKCGAKLKVTPEDNSEQTDFEYGKICLISEGSKDA